jgi:hypothetical protein
MCFSIVLLPAAFGADDPERFPLITLNETSQHLENSFCPNSQVFFRKILDQR